MRNKPPCPIPESRQRLALRRLSGMRLYVSAAALLLSASGFSWAAKLTIGPVVDVTILPWGLRLSARVDTGAATSVLGVRNLRRVDNVAEFEFREKWGGQRVRLPVMDMRKVRSADGRVETRPVVEMTLSVGTETFKTQVMLDDRSRMTYAMLIGRRALSGRCVVDVDAAGSGAATRAGAGR